MNPCGGSVCVGGYWYSCNELGAAEDAGTCTFHSALGPKTTFVCETGLILEQTNPDSLLGDSLGLQYERVGAMGVVRKRQRCREQ